MHVLRVANPIPFSVLACLALAGCGQGPAPATPESAPKGSPAHIREVTAAVDDAALRNADARPGDWLTYGRNYREDRYSPLDGIHRENVGELGLAWTLDLGTKRGIQTTPLVVDGIMFLTGPWSVVYAVDVRKGTLIWQYDPGVYRGVGTRLCCGVSNRGPALYKGAVFVGTLDGRLISIDAADGTPNWEVMTVDPEGYQSITGAPRIANGLVLIGNGGAEFTARGYVSAYHADTGELAWRFYTVPGNPDDGFEHPDLKHAAATWTGSWWELGGGGTAWDSIAYDPDLDRVYIGVGNGTPWNRLRRSPEGGDNLYLSSIVAVDAGTGEYLWHFQTTPGDTWDYTATQHIMRADLGVEGDAESVIMQAPKNGFFYVLDGETGAFRSGAAFAYMNWATGLDANGRPIEREGARYEDGRKHRIAPSPHGGHNWQPMSYNPETGWVYIPAVEQIGSLRYDRDVPDRSRRRVNGGNGATNANNLSLYVEEVPELDPRAPKPGQAYGRLIAWDPVAQELKWEVRHPHFYNGGLLSTAGGLLFQGDAEGGSRSGTPGRATRSGSSTCAAAPSRRRSRTWSTANSTSRSSWDGAAARGSGPRESSAFILARSTRSSSAATRSRPRSCRRWNAKSWRSRRTPPSWRSAWATTSTWGTASTAMARRGAAAERSRPWRGRARACTGCCTKSCSMACCCPKACRASRTS